MKHIIHYTLRAEGPEGEIIEATVPEEPFAFTHGADEVLDALEGAVSKAGVGDRFELLVPFDEAYGPEMEGAFAVLPKEQFIDNEGFDESVMAEGEVVVMRDDEGDEVHGVVVYVGEDEVEVDFNHPLAGIDLHFTIQVMGREEE